MNINVEEWLSAFGTALIGLLFGFIRALNMIVKTNRFNLLELIAGLFSSMGAALLVYLFVHGIWPNIDGMVVAGLGGAAGYMGQVVLEQFSNMVVRKTMDKVEQAIK